MIAKLDGVLLELHPPSALISVAGVAYEVDLPLSDCEMLPAFGAKVSLYTHLQIREDAHSLYGFLSRDSRDCFRGLIKVSGIGARIALALLSTLTVEQLIIAVNNADKTILCKTPGVGAKVAERMILELKGKLGLGYTSVDTGAKFDVSIRNDIVKALTSLGYSDKDILRVMKGLPLEITKVSVGIKAALQLLSIS